MNNNEWQQIGEDIKRQVQDAIDANDFSRLSKSIGDTVGQAVDGMGRSINDVVGSVGKNLNEAVGEVGKSLNEAMDEVGRSLTGAADEVRTGFALPSQGSGRKTPRRMKPDLRPDRRFFGKPRGKALGIVMIGFGFSLFGTAGFLAFIFLMLFLFGGQDLIVSLTFAVLAAVGAGIGCRGITLKERANRFKRYVAAAQQKLYCSIEELSHRIGKSRRFVLKDIRKMIQKGWFPQAHLDKQESCLIVSDELYEQYRLTQSNYEEQQQQLELEKKRLREQTKAGTGNKAENRNGTGNDQADGDGKGRTEYEKMLEEGQNYVRMIRLCNDEIPGEEMSGKLYKLELLVTRIFDRVEKEPELAPDLHKMLNYYLPTTQKLLEAYRDLDRQNLELDNISRTKKEIEDTLDTINQAFEKFLDELFREKAWDIQTDISVLHTMLKQDGYLNGDFEKAAK
ncbi:MAG: hypothetical protein HFI51_10275 [Lachnospiraceae bacterium]|mgnify:CR=1 FL=1|nr:hypothetical protein [Lachnospiraceae bacterium]